MDCEQFFAHLWQKYLQLTPQAAKIRQLFVDQGNSIVNDHVAFRTFDVAPISIDELEHHLLGLGYKHYENYQFAQKHLLARAYLPKNPRHARIFLSELITAELSSRAQEVIYAACQTIDEYATRGESIFWGGRLWSMPSWQEYNILLNESEYAAWLIVHGLCANHFTLSVNALNEPNLEYVNARLQQAGFRLNGEGGAIKGTPEVLLEQSATLADRVDMIFRDGDIHSVPSCFYEFAKRYHDGNGRLFQGFVPDNANKIFHSTDLHPRSSVIEDSPGD